MKISSKKYSLALFQSHSKNKEELKESCYNLVLLKKVFSNKQIINFFLNPDIDQKKKFSVLETLRERIEINDNIVNCLKIIISNSEVKKIGKIVDEFKNLAYEELNELSVKLEYKNNLTPKETKDIEDFIAKKTQKKPDIEMIKNEDLIGGFKIIYGSEVFEGNCKEDLRQIEKTILN